ncbi:2'-5' RNA ligase family protein [Flavihumibacter rivuli]|uniref:2'-5' RNA ligase family protein n=1 Tax=Flavihumibacter rivuli TaxID=2838156 RepID=UPI001BDEF3B0|nr:2'-5' RNA ligase family protein [Flavihumibacter rivuli]ULQ57121.1 2'-5' RNA ligase family protein [Flavihumibacter rivuli]
MTLFVAPEDATPIEQIRQQYNPLQFEIIKAHVTLCREDEIENIEPVIANLLSLTKTKQPILIGFGKVTRFDNGKGLYLPAANDNEEFDELRSKILNGIIENPRKHEAHITLMHPRNSTCTDEIHKQVQTIDLPTQLYFNTISLIEQKDGGQWKIVHEFNMEDGI